MSNIDPSNEGEVQIDIREYRQAMERAAAAEKLAAERDQALKLKDVEVAIQLAGLPTGTGAGKAFVNTYEGPLDEETIRAKAIEFGLIKAEGAPAGGTPADQVQVDADRQALQHGGLPPDVSAQPPPRHPGEEGLERFWQRVNTEGARKEDAAGEVVDRLVDAANKGDDRVIIPNR